MVESCEEVEKAKPEIGQSQFFWAFRLGGAKGGKESGTAANSVKLDGLEPPAVRKFNAL